MKPRIFQITNNDLSVVYKGYTIKYTDNVREKIWADGVYPTYGKAERAAKRLIKSLRKEHETNKKGAS